MLRPPPLPAACLLPPMAGWLQGRNRRCITVDLHNAEGRGLERRLADGWAEVLVENFRPGVMEKWEVSRCGPCCRRRRTKTVCGIVDSCQPAPTPIRHARCLRHCPTLTPHQSPSPTPPDSHDRPTPQLGPADLKPSLVYTRISGYGQTGPKAQLPGYASVCEAYGGFRSVWFGRVDGRGGGWAVGGRRWRAPGEGARCGSCSSASHMFLFSLHTYHVVLANTHTHTHTHLQTLLPRTAPPRHTAQVRQRLPGPRPGAP